MGFKKLNSITTYRLLHLQSRFHLCYRHSVSSDRYLSIYCNSVLIYKKLIAHVRETINFGNCLPDFNKFQ